LESKFLLKDLAENESIKESSSISRIFVQCLMPSFDNKILLRCYHAPYCLRVITQNIIISLCFDTFGIFKINIFKEGIFILNKLLMHIDVYIDVCVMIYDAINNTQYVCIQFMINQLSIHKNVTKRVISSALFRIAFIPIAVILSRVHMQIRELHIYTHLYARLSFTDELRN